MLFVNLLNIYYNALFFILLVIFALKSRQNKKPLKTLPTITVAIPAYNEEKVIGKAIKSLLKMDYPKEKMEIIVVENNCSTDKTLGIAKGYEKEGVKVFSIKEGGKANALNFALKHASSEIFAILDADTFFSKKSFRSMVGCFIDNEVACVQPSLRIFNPASILEKMQSFEYTMSIFLKKSLSILNSSLVSGCACMIRKNFLFRTGGFDTNNLTEDIEIGMRMNMKGHKIFYDLCSEAYTAPKKNFKSLFNQRLRWSLGFLENAISKKLILNYKFGIFGIVTSMMILTIPLSIFGFFDLCYSTTYRVSDFILHRSASNDVMSLRAETMLFPIPILFSDIFSYACLALQTFFIIFLVRKVCKGPYLSTLPESMYHIFYWILIPIISLLIVGYKLFGREFRFGGVVWRNSIINKLSSRIV